MEKKKFGVAGVISVVLAVLNAIGLLVSLGFSLHIRHKFIEIYEDLGAELPILTQGVLNTHWTIWILISLLLLVVLIVKEFIPKKRIPLVLNGLFFLLGIVYWAVFSTAMMVPLMELIQQMENG